VAAAAAAAAGELWVGAVVAPPVAGSDAEGFRLRKFSIE
jgi:hypothetical protein